MDYAAIFETLKNPEFGKAGRVHDWRNHVPECIVDTWDTLALESRLIAYIVADNASDNEEWK